MSLKATIYKVELQLSDIDRGVYGEYPITIARHPSETEEYLLTRVGDLEQRAAVRLAGRRPGPAGEAPLDQE